MPTSTPRTSKSKSWLVLFGIVSVFLLIFMLCLAYVLVFRPTAGVEAAVTSTPNPALQLPTAPAPTSASGLPLPEHTYFTVEEPVQGFSNCEGYRFSGVVKNSNGTELQGVQVVVWDHQSGLVALNETDAQGFYRIDLESLPLHQKVWLQIYENDVPVSQPLLIEPDIGCQTGFQFYTINWQRSSGE